MRSTSTDGGCCSTSSRSSPGTPGTPTSSGRASTEQPAASQVVVVNGPIAAGKSTLAAALADALRAEGRTVAVVGVDEVVAMTVVPEGTPVLETWGRARAAHGALVAGFVDAGIETVIVDGPFHDEDERRPLLEAVASMSVEPRWFTLVVPYEEALRRVGLDPTRKFSRDPVFLRRTHDRFRAESQHVRSGDVVLDSFGDDVPTLVAKVLSLLA